jgi:mannobiose 2-epimerase
MLERVLDSSTGHFHLFFDDDWTVKSDGVSVGHDIEGSWLLVEAAEALGDEALVERARAASVAMAVAVLRDGVGRDGAVLWEADAAGNVGGDRHWWPQAEGLVGLLNAYQLSGDDRFLHALFSLWDFIRRYVVDRARGEWFWKVDAGGVPDPVLPKVSQWKCPYHNSRACFELLDRLSALEELRARATRTLPGAEPA